MKYGFSFGIFLILLASCSQSHQKELFRSEEKTLTFRTDFPAYNLNYFTDSQQREFVSFADFITFKKISFHSLNNNKKWSVNLGSLMDTEKVAFIHYRVISADSILLLTKNTNQFFLINRKAEVLRRTDFSKLLSEGIEFAPWVYFENQKLYFTVNHYPIKKISKKEEIADWNAHSMKLEQIGKLNYEKKTDQVIYYGKDLVNRFLEPDDIDAQGTYYVVNKQQLYYFSPYSDTIYRIHKNGIEPLIKIVSRIGKTHIIPSTREQYNKNVNCINDAYVQQSFICEMLFDNKHNLIYIFVRKPKKGNHFPFNILVYNSKFKRLGEKEFDGINHYPNGFVGKKGLYLLRNYGKHPNQKSFDLLNYEK